VLASRIRYFCANTFIPQLMKKFTCILIAFFGFFAMASAQHEDLKQRIKAFVEAHGADYEKKYLNISEAKIGDIEGQSFDFSEKFMLRAKKKTENELGNMVKAKYYVNIYAYEDKSDRDYALKHWFKNFVEGGSIRPGITTRNYQHATPTIIVINELDVCVLNYSCNLYDYEAYKKWKDSMLQFFGDEKSVVVEIKCNGPIEWTQNPPDPKDRSWK
jgi:hypothetical protein